MGSKKGFNKEFKRFLNDLILLRDSCKLSNDAALRHKYKLLQKRYVDQLDYLIDRRTWKYKNFSNYEDLKQEGRVALVMALNSYCPTKGDFFWWVDKYIKTRITREANRHSTIKMPMKYAKKHMPYKVSKIPIMADASPMVCDSIHLAQISERVRKAVNKLPEDQRQVVQSYFEFDNNNLKRSNSIAGVCKSLKMSRFKCVELLEKAKDILKKELSNIE